MASRGKKVPVTNIPSVNLRSSRPMSPVKLQSIGSDPFLGRSSSSCLDPAEQAILAASESKVRRKKEETRLELVKIQERIDYTLTEYQGPKIEDEEEKQSTKEVDLHAVKSPEELYKLLTDVRLRTKYQQHVTVLLLGHEEAAEGRERLLQSIHEFFQETQAGNTTQLLEELASEEIDFDEATAGLESALKTAQAAGDRLLEIKKDMGQLFSVVKAFPDTKKGRKKMEKALLKAQEEVESLRTQLQGVQGELEGSKEKSGRLQKQIDSKTTECERLRKTAAQVDQLQKTNAELQLELAKAKEAAQKAQGDFERERQDRLRLLAKKEDVKEVVKVDDSQVQELQAALEREKEALERLKDEMDAKFQIEKEALVAEHESEIEEMRSRYEEQMKSLMEDDIFSDTGGEGEEEGQYEGGEEVDFGTGEPEMDEQDGGLASKSTVEKLKLEYQQREKKLKEEVDDVKSKSRKTITGLKIQLTEAENRHSDMCSKLQKQIDNLEMSVNGERERKLSLEAQLADAATREAEQQTHIVQLQREMGALATRLEGAGSDMPSNLLQLVNKSAQWSEQHLSGPTSPPVPIVPMDEVLYSCEPSALQLHPQAFPGGTPQSIQSHFPGGTPFSEGSQQIQFPGGFPTSLDHSPASHDHYLGSPLQEFPAAQPQNALHMLAQSRLSHHSPQAPLTHDHPIVSEWNKAYDLVMKFRDGVVDMLCDDERFENEVEDLRSIEGATMERDQDVQGQVTQMRFSLSLMLHQMEVTLQESFSKLLAGGGASEGDGEEVIEIRNLKLAQAQLKKKLRQTEDTHKIELQESKETIANLSNKVETLRMEIASLRHSMATPTTNEPGSTLAMFTRLDYDHNTRQLQAAVKSEQLSPMVYQKVNKKMDEYLQIPAQRLAHIGKRQQEKRLAEKLVCDVQREFLDGQVAGRVVNKIKSWEEQKQFRFEWNMDQLREKRSSLAYTLTTQLGEVEEEMKMLLIKPIYGSCRAKSTKHQDLITPLPRPVPIRTPAPYRHSRTRTSSGVGERDSGVGMEGGCHPGMRLVSRLVASRQGTRRGERAVEESERVSCQGTPLPPPRPGRDRGAREKERGSRREGEGEWHVEHSRPPTQLEGPFSPLMFQAPPTMPRIMELDVSRKSRHPADLLKHLLTDQQLKPSTASPLAIPHTQQQSSAVQSKLVTHCSNDFLPSCHLPTSQSHSLPFPHSPTLPPISVPSNGPLTAA